MLRGTSSSRRGVRSAKSTLRKIINGGRYAAGECPLGSHEGDGKGTKKMKAFPPERDEINGLWGEGRPEKREIKKSKRPYKLNHRRGAPVG